MSVLFNKRKKNKKQKRFVSVRVELSHSSFLLLKIKEQKQENVKQAQRFLIKNYFFYY